MKYKTTTTTHTIQITDPNLTLENSIYYYNGNPISPENINRQIIPSTPIDATQVYVYENPDTNEEEYYLIEEYEQIISFHILNGKRHFIAPKISLDNIAKISPDKLHYQEGKYFLIDQNGNITQKEIHPTLIEVNTHGKNKI